MTEGRVYSNTTTLPFSDTYWKMLDDSDAFLSGEVEITYTFEKDLDNEWSLDEVELYFTDIQLADSEGNQIIPDPITAARAEAFLLGHTRLNDRIDEKVYDDFNHR